MWARNFEVDGIRQSEVPGEDRVQEVRLILLCQRIPRATPEVRMSSSDGDSGIVSLAGWTLIDPLSSHLLMSHPGC